MFHGHQFVRSLMLKGTDGGHASEKECYPSPLRFRTRIRGEVLPEIGSVWNTSRDRNPRANEARQNVDDIVTRGY